MPNTLTMYPLSISCGCLLAMVAGIHAHSLKVDLNPPDRRGDVLTPDWDNWGWQTGASGSRSFGEVTVTFLSASTHPIGALLNKGLLDYGVHLGCDGIAVANRDSGD